MNGVFYELLALAMRQLREHKRVRALLIVIVPILFAVMVFFYYFAARFFVPEAGIPSVTSRG